MVTAESVIIAVFGAILGVTIGTGLGLTVISTLADDGLGAISIPVTQLASWVAAGGIAGVLAAVLPARKAARLDVLDAISYE
jgi:putative ABC transport system permease protein